MCVHACVRSYWFVLTPSSVQEMEQPKTAPATGTPTSLVSHTETTMPTQHHLPGPPGIGDFRGYHHIPPLTRMGAPPGMSSAYPHKVVSDQLPPMGMPFPHHYNMSMPHGMLIVDTIVDY